MILGFRRVPSLSSRSRSVPPLRGFSSRLRGSPFSGRVARLFVGGGDQAVLCGIEAVAASGAEMAHGGAGDEIDLVVMRRERDGQRIGAVLEGAAVDLFAGFPGGLGGEEHSVGSGVAGE
jgi:hypothetical protein